MLEEVADGLRGLSETEIKEVLDHLEKAVAAPDPTTATDEQKAAYAKHRRSCSSSRHARPARRHQEPRRGRRPPRRAADKQIKLIAETHTNSTLPARRGGRVADDREELADEQADLRNEVVAIFKQVKRPRRRAVLTPEQKDRVEKAEALLRGSQLAAEMDATVRTAPQGGRLRRRRRARSAATRRN